MPPDATRSDVELLLAWRDGEERAGDSLLSRHSAAIRRFFEAHGAPEIDEMAQRTFAACIERRDHLREDGNFRAYLFGIARNQLLRTWTAQRRTGASVTPSAAVLADGGMSATGAIARAEDLESLHEALDRIRPKYRTPLELFYFEEQSLAQIATTLEIPVGTVKSRLSRAKAMLRKEIGAVRVTQETRVSIEMRLERDFGDD